jgi:transcriptional regulator with GAF, ATPase, and Fis domain
MPSDPELPPGYRLTAPVSAARGLWRVADDRGEHLLRWHPGPLAGQALRELELLGQLPLERCARLTDCGLHAGRGYVCREWVPGDPLDRLAGTLDETRAAALFGGLARSLAELHALGCTHGDVKLANAIASDSGDVRLIDLGLGHLAGSGGAGAGGSLLHAAPELLSGASPAPAADAFALGVALAHLLEGRLPDAGEFYGRFPRQSFLEAAELSMAQWPSWARRIAPRLLARDPAERANVAEVLRLLDDPEREVAPPLPQLPWGLGHSEGLRGWLRDRLDAETDVFEVVVELDSEVDSLMRALHVAATELGVPASRSELRNAPAHREPQGDRGSGAPCVWLRGRGTDELLGQQWERWIAANAARGSGRSKLFYLRPRAEQSDLPADRARTAPTCDGVALAAWVHESFDGSRVDLDRLARGLATQGGGSPGKTARLLERLAEVGWLRASDRRWRLAQCQLPLPDDEDHASAPSEDAARLWCTLHLLGPAANDAPWWTAPHLADLRFARPWQELEERRALQGSLHAVEWVAEPPAELREVWNATLVSLRSDREHAPSTRAFADWLGDETATRRAIDRLVDLRAAGVPSQALERVEHALALHAYAGRAVPAWLELERALCLAQLGQAPAALDVLEQLDERERLGATGRLARAWVHLAQGEAAEALAELEGADSGGAADMESCSIAMRLDLELSRPRIALQRAERLASEPEGAAPWRAVCNVSRMEALARAALGDLERATELLRRRLREAFERGDVAARAVLLSNLASVLRQAGRTRTAVGCLRRAAYLAELGNQVAAESTARSQLGALLRERGRRGAARAALDRALELKHYLGDERGAFDVEALRALCESEGGHLGRARIELEALHAAARERGYAATAERLAARLAWVRARLGLPADTDLDTQGEGESPHTWIDRARTRALVDGTAGIDALRERRRLAEDQSRAQIAWGLHLIEKQLERVSCPPPPVRQEPWHLETRLWNALLDTDALAELEDLGERFAELQRNDLAARAWIALASRLDDEGQARARARTLLQPLVEDLDEAQGRALLESLLGVPDPRPAELERFASGAGSAADGELLRLLRLNRRLVGKPDLDQLLPEIVRCALEVTGAERGFLATFEEQRFHVRVAIDRDLGPIPKSTEELSESILARALRADGPLNLSNALDEPGLEEAPSVLELDLRSVLCASFTTDGELRGVIAVDHRMRTGAFGERSTELLGLLADQASLAISQTARLEEIQRLNRRLGDQVATQSSQLRQAQDSLIARGLDAPLGGLIGRSKSMAQVRQTLRKVARTSLSVLITGPSGTGKELAARALHEASDRASQPFVAENVAALPSSLAEAELFGYERGAFTGAERRSPGVFERAEGGTLFLDEVGELPLDLQAKLLRVLETRQVRRLGSDRVTDVDFRLVAATLADLPQRVAGGSFREDLYYRLAGVAIHMPTLEERPEDLPDLVEHLLRLLGRRDARTYRATRELLDALQARAWPGNVRQLRNTLERLCALSEGADLEPSLLEPAPRRKARVPSREPGVVRPLAELEREAIEQALEHAKGDKREAARLLGISRAKVYQRLKEWADAEGSANRPDPGSDPGSAPR